MVVPPVVEPLPTVEPPVAEPLPIVVPPDVEPLPMVELPVVGALPIVEPLPMVVPLAAAPVPVAEPLPMVEALPGVTPVLEFVPLLPVAAPLPEVEPVPEEPVCAVATSDAATSAAPAKIERECDGNFIKIFQVKVGKTSSDCADKQLKSVARQLTCSNFMVSAYCVACVDAPAWRRTVFAGFDRTPNTFGSKSNAVKNPRPKTLKFVSFRPLAAVNSAQAATYCIADQTITVAFSGSSESAIASPAATIRSGLDAVS